MSGSQFNLEFALNLKTSKPQPQNLATATAIAATSILYSSGTSSFLREQSEVHTSQSNKEADEQSVVESSASTASSNTIMSNTNGSTTHTNGTSTTGVLNGSSLTGTGYNNSVASTGSYRLASMDRLAQRHKLYDSQNGAVAGDNVSFRNRKNIQLNLLFFHLHM